MAASATTQAIKRSRPWTISGVCRPRMSPRWFGRKRFRRGSRDGGAGAARRGQPGDQRRGRPSPGGCAGAGRRHRCSDRAQRERRAAGRRAGHRQGQYRPGRVRHHQRRQAAARPDRAHQQSGGRQSAQGRRGHSRTHQLPGVFLSLVHHQSDARRHQKSARSRHHAGRLVRRRRRGGRRRHRPYRARHRHRRLDPLSRLCLRRSRPAADGRACRGLQCVAARTHHRAADLARYPVRWRAPSAISGSRWRRCRAGTCAIPGGCRRRSKDRRCRSAPRCAFSPDGLETVG